MIYITAGHSPKHGPDYDPGAVANNYKEADLAARLRDKVVAHLKLLGAVYKTDQDDWNLNETIAGAKTTEKDVVFDIHFNAATPAATGCEVFIPERNTDLERATAKTILDGMVKLLKLPSRGVKTEAQCRHKRLGIMRPNGSNFLVEVCFITNKTDLVSFFAAEDELAKFYAQALVDLDNKDK